MRWQQKRDDVKERLHDMNEYEQGLIHIKRIVCNKSKIKSESIYKQLLLDLEMDAHISGHEAGLPDDIIAKDIVNALKCTNGRYYLLDESKEDLIQLRKKMRADKPKRKCRCKK
jgi:hypothetical protein